MFSIIFPGQGSQIIGMGNEFYQNFTYVRDFFTNADDLLKKKLSKLILEGPKNKLDLTENTQSAIFLVSYSIFKVIEKETNFDLKSAEFYAGHSLGEYSALCCSQSINFEQTIHLLNHRGKAMQDAVPEGVGGMYAVLGVNIDEIHKILKDNLNNFKCYVANDNTIGQIAVSGKLSSLILLGEELKKNKIKFIQLPVSAPFHCPLMKKATDEMKQKILDTKFEEPTVDIISNVTAKPQKKSEEIKNLLIQQIEQPVRWRESINNMIGMGVNRFIEIGPGKVLSGLVKRINKDVKISTINIESDVRDLKL